MMKGVGVNPLIKLILGVAVFILIGCYERQMVPLCKEDGECLSGRCRDGRCVSASSGDEDTEKESDSDPPITSGYSETMTGVDVLFVVDNTSSMLHEQGVMSSAIRLFLIKLTEQLIGGLSLDFASLDARLAVTTPDMGVTAGGNPPEVWFEDDEGCMSSSFGNNGVMHTAYSDDYSWDRPCPAIDPFVTDEMFLTLSDNSLYQEFVDTMTCMMPTGLHGCSIVQPLSASVAAISNHGQESFLRKNALTVIIVVSDKDDCSIEQGDWIDNFDDHGDLRSFCSAGNDVLFEPSALKKRLIDAKTNETGVDAEGSILFAAITGVPFDNDCQGSGNTIDSCKNVSLPTGGTMLDPYRGVDAYACEVWDGGGDALVQANPGMRLVQVAQEFGELGYVYSICNENWNSAMSEIAGMIGSLVEE